MQIKSKVAMGMKQGNVSLELNLKQMKRLKHMFEFRDADVVPEINI